MPNRRQLLQMGACAAALSGWGRIWAAEPARVTADRAFYAALTRLADAPLPQLQKEIPPLEKLAHSPAAMDDYIAVSQAVAITLSQVDAGYPDPSGPYVVTQRNGAWQKAPGSNDPALVRAIDADSQTITQDAARGVVPPDFIVKPMVSRLEASARTAGPDVAAALQRQAEKLASLPHRHDAGAWALPRGDIYYAAALIAGATGPFGNIISCETLHREALDEIAKINDRLIPLLERQGYTTGSVGARLHALAQDTRYLYDDSAAGRAEAVADMNRWLSTARPVLARQFDWLPKDVTVEMAAPGKRGWRTAPAYDGSKAGAYYVDLRAIRTRPRWSLRTVVHHETLPGHLLQQPIQDKVAPPMLRVRATAMAYTEGWAIYGEEFCAELGLFAGDPLSEIGLWQSVLMRLARQLIDTGINYKRWSREQALSTLSEVCGDMPESLTAEVDRVVVQPGATAGQAIGRTAIWRLRRHAESTLKQRFDLKAFHAMVLNRGPVTVTMLERMTDRFITARAG